MMVKSVASSLVFGITHPVMVGRKHGIWWNVPFPAYLHTSFIISRPEPLQGKSSQRTEGILAHAPEGAGGGVAGEVLTWSLAHRCMVWYDMHLKASSSPKAKREALFHPIHTKKQLDTGYELVWGIKDQLAKENKQVTKQNTFLLQNTACDSNALGKGAKELSELTPRHRIPLWGQGLHANHLGIQLNECLGKYMAKQATS